MALLILARHGQSEWNKKGLWTGITDIPLSEEGVLEARKAAEALSGILIGRAHVSPLSRARRTLEEMFSVLGLADVPVRTDDALRERHYGIFTGKNKWQVREEIGEEEFHRIRRGWDAPIPEGESLKDVHARVVPYFEEYILPDLLAGHHTLVVGHNNTFRALIKHIEGISDEMVSEIDIPTGGLYRREF